MQERVKLLVSSPAGRGYYLHDSTSPNILSLQLKNAVSERHCCVIYGGNTTVRWLTGDLLLHDRDDHGFVNLLKLNHLCICINYAYSRFPRDGGECVPFFFIINTSLPTGTPVSGHGV